MNESKKKQIEIGVIIICLVFMLFKIWHSKAKAGKSALLPNIAETGTFNLSEAKRKLENLDVAPKEKREHLTERGRDIFQKPASVSALEKKALYGNPDGAKGPETAQQKLILEGTMWGVDKNMAIISGRVVREGDMIDSAKVLKIVPDKVVISLNGSETELKR